MTGDAAGYIGSIPEHYDRNLGPLLFIDYAADISDRVAACSPARVLETAAGTGIVTRQLRDRLPAGVHLTAIDLNPPMLEIARTKFQASEEVEFRPADATALPFADSSFDAVACQFGVMFFPDKNKSYREVYRVLAAGGHYLGFASPQLVCQNRPRGHGQLFSCWSASIPEPAVLLPVRTSQRLFDRRGLHRRQRGRRQV
jgi:ubiquinone/menaquinone biosynthesis C-methylase UbiE